MLRTQTSLAHNPTDSVPHALNQNGQGLIEYLIIVAIIAVGSMVATRVLGSNIKAQFAHINSALTDDRHRVHFQDMPSSVNTKQTMRNFMQGARDQE